ncbi:hypothetical protein HNQ60_004105 [Povalibacter uvarum]|uniref:Cell envelope protein n=1 Tax=Povalibacter uvarum TaxID=732238 RepID=A0A841HTP1_9GAMM|nr:DUF1254 domain-containing protein [Povalibacter uvarum]MBB6095215.1 hypothetical protein [Povalibacter uvarum]
MHSSTRTLGLIAGAALLLLGSGCRQKTADPAPPSKASMNAAQGASLEEMRAIAKEAYTYGFPLVDNYRVQYSYFADAANPEYKTGWNQIFNNARVYTPDDKAIQTPNSDTPYSYVGADLRAEPLVLSVPAMEKNRFYHLQFIDQYTQNFAYVGTRTTGNDAGTFLLAGPRWQGEAPAGIKQVIKSETDFAFILYRTQLFDPSDIANVKKVQSGYKVQTLSSFMGQAAPPAAPTVDFIKPLTATEQRSSLEFFNVLNFVLQFCPTVPSEVEIMERFGKLGIGAGKTLDAQALSPQMRAAIEGGMADSWQAFKAVDQQAQEGKLTSADFFGTREHLRNNYEYRMAAAAAGIYGNSIEEAFYTQYKGDTSVDRFVLHFPPGQLPPVDAFWSLTMYEMPASLLYANPLKRYLINSPMLPKMKKDADGGLTLYVQHESPGKAKESNWLPAPAGPMMVVLRLYAPKQEVRDGTWKRPALQKVE